MLVGLLVGGIALAAAILVPLIPLLMLAFVVWVVWRLTTGSTRALTQV
jgi:hypothetical protein